MTAVAVVATAVCVVAVVALLYAEARAPHHRRWSKMLASMAFVVVAVTAGALDSGFGRWVVVALVLSWVGDLALTYLGRSAFLIGLGAFLFAHVAYVTGFAVRGVATPRWWEIAVVAGLGAVILWWLLPHVDDEMRPPVLAYVAAITAMVLLAVATDAFDADARIPAGAVAFYVSDVAVARDRFVSPGVVNRLWGLPLYYFGQLLLAWAAGG